MKIIIYGLVAIGLLSGCAGGFKANSRIEAIWDAPYKNNENSIQTNA